MELKDKILVVLTPIFGDSVKKIIEENYSSNNPEELISMAYHMLSGYLGENNAKKLLGKIIKENPAIKITG